MEQLAAERVFVWGDSLAKGVFWNESRKRHAYCKTTAVDIAANRLGIEIVNRSKIRLHRTARAWRCWSGKS